MFLQIIPGAPHFLLFSLQSVDNLILFHTFLVFVTSRNSCFTPTGDLKVTDCQFMFIKIKGKAKPDMNIGSHVVCAYNYTYTRERFRTLNVTCHRTAVIVWHCGADICVLSVQRNKQPKSVHDQVAVPLTQKAAHFNWQ